jgi:hypothetical protein
VKDTTVAFSRLDLFLQKAYSPVFILSSAPAQAQAQPAQAQAQAQPPEGLPPPLKV